MDNLHYGCSGQWLHRFGDVHQLLLADLQGTGRDRYQQSAIDREGKRRGGEGYRYGPLTGEMA